MTTLLSKVNVNYLKICLKSFIDGDEERAYASPFRFEKTGDDIRIEYSVKDLHICRGKSSRFEELWNDLITWLGKSKTCTSCGQLSFDIKPLDLCFPCSYSFMCSVPDDDCAICKEHLNTLPVCLTLCNHYFHIKCLMRLQAINHEKINDMDEDDEDEDCWNISCPLCRGIINPSAPESYTFRIKNTIAKGVGGNTTHLHVPNNN